MDEVVLTFDLDWCSDDILLYLLNKLIPNRIPATFFVTHQTRLLDIIRDYDFFELGIHPNFNENSTHGNSYKSIIDHCLSIVKDAIFSRSHCLDISSIKLEYLMLNGIKIECSTFMPMTSVLNPFHYRLNEKEIIRVPFNWEDDYEFYQKDKKYNFDSLMSLKDKIFNFHPIHVYLNSSSQEHYYNFKSNELYNKSSERMGGGRGAETLLDSIILKHNLNHISVVKFRDFLFNRYNITIL